MPRRPDPEAEAIVAGHHGYPFAFLGMHEEAGGLIVRAYLPDAEALAVVDGATGEIIASGERIHPAGVFIARMPERRHLFRYRLRVRQGGQWH